MSAATKKRYSFRFLDMTAQQAADLGKRGSRVKISPGWKKGIVVGVVPLRESINYSWIKAFIRKGRISKSKCDIFISIRTDYDTKMLGVPKYVLRIIHDTKVNITFSFTSITP